MLTPVTAPPIDRQQATARVAEAGEAAAAAAGLRCVTQRSPGSESTYLHVLRDGWWRGVRISCHAAVYDCCIDYAQLRLPDTPCSESVANASERVRTLVVAGGEVIADPSVVNAAIERLAAVLCDGRRYRDAAGVRWRWTAADQAWRRDGVGRVVATPPVHRPCSLVSPRICCQVRHAANVNARWAVESSLPPAGDP